MELNTLTTHAEFVQYCQQKISETQYWTDKEASALVTVLSDILADIGVSNNSAILISAREAFIQLARRASSILAGARFLGVPIKGKSNAVVRALCVNSGPSPTTVSKFDVFTVGGAPAFATHSQQIAPSSQQYLDLAMGTVVEESFYCNTQEELRQITLGVQEFRASNVSVWVTSATGLVEEYSECDLALTAVEAGNPVYKLTYSDSGELIIIFGGKGFGKAAAATSTIHVRYTVCDGSQDNNDATGLQVQSVENPEVGGKTVEPISGGSDELPLAWYRQFAPILSLSRQQLSRPDEWRAAILSWPGVADCKILSQRDIAPNDPTWMQCLRICVLPTSGGSLGGVNPNPSSAAWTRLLEYIAKYRPLHVAQTWNPTRVQVSVNVVIAVFDGYPIDLRDVEAQALAQIQALRQPRIGSLGRMLALTDIVSACNSESGVRLPHIDWVKVLSPTQDIPCGSLEYIWIKDIRVRAVYSDRAQE